VVQGHILVGPGERDDPICTEMAASPLPSGRGQPGHPLLSFVACAVVCRRSALLAADVERLAALLEVQQLNSEARHYVD
jgi:hypothetical protein